MLDFYLGTHMPNWLTLTRVPLFVAIQRLTSRCRTLPRAIGRWALDSGGYSTLSVHGEWRMTPKDYAGWVRRLIDDVGGLDFAAIQDWMCEAHVLAKTGLTVRDHQERTVTSYLTLRDLAPEVPWLPVVQGYEPADYLRCVDMYASAGVDLRKFDRVGVGTLCRRHATREALEVIDALHGGGAQASRFRVQVSGAGARRAEAVLRRLAGLELRGAEGSRPTPRAHAPELRELS